MDWKVENLLQQNLMITAVIQHPDKGAKQMFKIKYNIACARYQRYSRFKYLGIKRDLEKGK